MSSDTLPTYFTSLYVSSIINSIFFSQVIVRPNKRIVDIFIRRRDRKQLETFYIWRY